MLDLIKSILNKASPENRNESAPQEVTEKELHIATCAILLEIAHADDEFSGDEEKRIVALMEENFDLSPDIVHEIKEISAVKREKSIDLWQFTKIIKDNYSGEQKEKIIEMIWGVIYADGHLDQHEDYLAHKLATLLGLNHRQLIDAKVKVVRQTKNGAKP